MHEFRHESLTEGAKGTRNDCNATFYKYSASLKCIKVEHNQAFKVVHEFLTTQTGTVTELYQIIYYYTIIIVLFQTSLRNSQFLD